MTYEQKERIYRKTGHGGFYDGKDGKPLHYLKKSKRKIGIKAKYKSRITGKWVYKTYKSVSSYVRAKKGLFRKKKLRLVRT